MFDLETIEVCSLILNYGTFVLARSCEMDANRRQSGIQQLLAAEQEAQQIVNAARAGTVFSSFSFWGVLVIANIQQKPFELVRIRQQQPL